jgi:hypothetical protein
MFSSLLGREPGISPTVSRLLCRLEEAVVFMLSTGDCTIEFT